MRSNFWKGRQRLNRLYRWIANVVRPKIDGAILFEAAPQNNPEVHDFLLAQTQARARQHKIVTRGLWLSRSEGLSATAELATALLRAARGAAGGCRARPLVLVAEYQAALLEVIG